MRFIWVVIFSVLGMQGAVANEIDIAGGIEYFQWAEFDSRGKLLDETGWRNFVAVDAKSWLNHRWLSDLGGRFYSGTVEYDGQTQSGMPATTDTNYDGYQFELGVTYVEQELANTGRAGIRMAVGIDSWRRALLGPGGYVENYNVTYGRLASHYEAGGLWSFNLGAKYPFATSETVGLESIGFASDVTLHPKGVISTYADIRLRLGSRWETQIYYDSYRFAKSDSKKSYYLVDNKYYEVRQPQSNQDVLGIKITFFI